MCINSLNRFACRLLAPVHHDAVVNLNLFGEHLYCLIGTNSLHGDIYHGFGAIWILGFDFIIVAFKYLLGRCDGHLIPIATIKCLQCFYC